MDVTFVQKMLHWVLKLMHIVAFIALMVMMFTVVANILGRIFFRSPVIGTLEIAGFCGVVFVSAAIGLAQKERRNIYVDVIAQRFSKSFRRITDSFTYFLSLVAVGILFWTVADSAIEAFVVNDRTLTLSVHTFPFRGIWTVGLLILFLFLLRHFVEFVKGEQKQ